MAWRIFVAMRIAASHCEKRAMFLAKTGRDNVAVVSGFSPEGARLL